LGAILTDEKPIQADDDRLLGYWRIARRAMGCEFNVLIPPRYPEATAAGEAALEQIERLEEQLSVYRDTSDLSYLNQNAGQGPVRVENRLYELLKRCAELTQQTQGAFDVSAGALVRAWGFAGGDKRIPGRQELENALARTGMQYVEFNDQDNSICYGRDGLEINLGSIGKGYAVDEAITLMRREFNIDSALIQGGFSSIFALGTPPGDPGGWKVAIQNPLNTRQYIATVRLRDRALGTSGTANQYFYADDKRYGHVLDPRTGSPADELAGASVIADDTATADALATALFVMGLDKTIDFCKNRPRIAALLVLKPVPASKKADLPRILSFNLPPEDLSLSPGQ